MTNGKPPSTSDSPATHISVPVTLGDAGRAVLLKHWQRALRHEAGARTGEDIEDVHRMRVATRRLRSAFRFFGAYVGLLHQDEIIAGLRVLAQRLGAVRDLDVLIARLDQEADADSPDRATIDAIVAALDGDRTRTRADLVAFLDGRAMATLRAQVADGFTQPASRSPANRDRPVHEAGPRLLARRAARALAGEADLLAPTSDELHDLRIRCKRLRYAAEFLLPYTQGKRLKQLIRLATALQDVLGELHDGDVMLDTLRSLVESASQQNGVSLPGIESAAVIRLLARQSDRRDALLLQFRSLWREFAGGRRQWRRKRLGQWFIGPTDGLAGHVSRAEAVVPGN
ncbi:MAG: hypothetical protein CL878_07090 [Dehalococcoidia bacterium]|nr:hypothetical protein [Dehalococcoidia bacterium]